MSISSSISTPSSTAVKVPLLPPSPLLLLLLPLESEPASFPELEADVEAESADTFNAGAINADTSADAW